MGPIKTTKSWADTNKTNKEKRKQWKEQKLLKKLEKQKQETTKIEEPVEKKQINVSTISIAVPGSILENAQSAELQSYLAGQIARAACIFQVDEVIIFDDGVANSKKISVDSFDGVKEITRCCVKLARILQYLECPQYLRKHLFPVHEDLQYAGILNPLDAPHHLRQSDSFSFREGVVTNKPAKIGKGSLVNVGLLQEIRIDKLLTPGLRCTVKLLPQVEGQKKLKGIVVSPDLPRQETGMYWGYTVRLANSLSQVFSQSPYKKGYDVTIGTSDKGSPMNAFECPKYKHLLVVFGGLHGLESALENDEVLNIDDPILLFDHYLNTIPNQGSRTVRTEEAILISLATLKPLLKPKWKVFTENT
ncbi:hypothetical protein RN001_004205 [Aquatica leii]|uniref:Uncharacterized protein n=1 Tax=Aquatica leii TaxID=1421715 RepID=A0AAN7PE52_9COLE|nr:hypothetical protein RN001_004205 [Aquatica leii]